MEELLAWCGQPLREHLRNAALLAKGDPEALRRVAKKAREMGVELNERLLRREVETAVKKLAELTGDGNVAQAAPLAAYLHDVGKAVSTFQLRLRSAGPRCNASLRGHEFWSAWIAYHTAERLCGEKTAALISAAVALHHAPRCSIDDVVLDALKIPTTEGDIEAMSSLAEEGAQLLGLDRDRVVAGLAVARWYWLRYFTAPHAQWLWRLRNTISRHRLQPAVELLRYIVVLVDNMDNALTRRDKAALSPFLK